MEQSRWTFEDRFDIVCLADLAPFTEEMIATAERGFGRSFSRERYQEAMSGAYVVIALDQRRSVAGFSVANLEQIGDQIDPVIAPWTRPDESIAYLKSAVIDPDHRGRGLYGALNRRRVEWLLARGASELTCLTQNPVVVRGHERTLQQLVDDGAIQGFVIERSATIRGRYGLQLAMDSRADSSPWDELDLAAGDAFGFLYRLERVPEANPERRTRSDGDSI